MTDSVFNALLQGRPEALALLPGAFSDPSAFCTAADAAGTRTISPALLAELARQTHNLPPSAARLAQLEKLARPGASVIVTGQQVGLFGGPLYTLHKAATAIARARLVEERTGRPCVPLFWLQTEDHDYPEIAHVAVLGATGRMVLALPKDAEPSRVSVAHRSLPPETSALLDRLTHELGQLQHGAELLALVRTHYVPGRPLAAAFAGMIAELWSEQGLLLLDPRAAAVAQLAAPLVRRVLDRHTEIEAALRARAAQITHTGCEVQVPVREGTSLVFFHPEGAQGPRYRLQHDAEGFSTPAGRITTQALHELLEQEPLRFSSSALLRPLVQDTCLPTCAYLGGPAEVSYFAELPPLYALLGVPMPLVAPRARLRVIDAGTRSLLEKLGLSPAEADVSRDTLLARVVGTESGATHGASLRDRLLAALTTELDALAQLGLHGVAGPLERTRETCSRSIEKLAESVDRAALERDGVLVARVDRLLAALRPGDAPQERAYGWISMAARVGPGALTHAVLNAAASLDPAVRDVYA